MSIPAGKRRHLTGFGIELMLVKDRQVGIDNVAQFDAGW